MKIKEQTRKLAVGCSKYSFEVADKTDEVSSKHVFEAVDETDEVSSKHVFEVVDETDEVSNHTHSKATLTRFEEIFEEYKLKLESLFNNKGEKTWLNTVLLEQGILELSWLVICKRMMEQRLLFSMTQIMQK
ncbi:hypothetical protein [Streptococcus mitis]|uniref:N-ethylammeline chlorohydrolase n=1 Tax=Streptococcus mitis TaxID=28037 RepID=A0A139PNY2_STRMT|nr:hypothetical protein [Streptococcus mitis]KXT92015.1 N-ethylammeline chlorohydrolase [Streptococcus mitis]